MSNDRFGNRNGSYGGSGNNALNEEEELKKIQAQIGHVENESLSSTARALRALNEAEEVGTKTATELVAQGEKLQKIEDTMDGVDSKLDSTQKNLNQLKGFFGNFKAKFGVHNKDGSKSAQNLKSKAPATNGKDAMAKSPSQGAMSGQGEKKSEFKTITGSDREAEINKNLDLMSSGLGRLKNLSLDMQKELDRQDPLINRLNDKSEKTNSRIVNQNDQMKKILK